MNITNTKKVIKQAYQKSIVPMIWSKAGVGKSEIVLQVAKELAEAKHLEFTTDTEAFDSKHFGFVDLRLGTQEVGDLIGNPYIKDGKTRHALPMWFPTNENSAGIIFIDELNRGMREVIQAIFQLVLNKRLHTHKLPEKWGIVSACNPEGEDYFVNSLDEALLTRFINIQFTPEVKELVAWGKNTGRLSLGITDYLEKYPNATGYKFDPLPIKTDPNPRVWEMLSKMLDGLEKDLWLEVSCALIGNEFALTFVNSLERDIDKPIRAEEVLNELDKHIKSIKKYADGKKSRTDLLRMTCDDLVRVCKQDNRVKFTKEQGKNLISFLKLIMVDLSFSVVKELVKIAELRDLFNADEELVKMLANSREIDK